MEKYSDIIKGADKYDVMLINKGIFKTIDDEKFEEVKTWLSGGNRAEWTKMFASKKSCYKFFLECARGNFNGSKERIRILNKIMEMETNVEATTNWK